jgi:hypothetical protein
MEMENTVVTYTTGWVKQDIALGSEVLRDGENKEFL